MAKARTNLRKNFDWYYANLRRLLPKYRGRVIAFGDGKVIGAYDTQYDAVKDAIDSGHPLGTFAVHLCVPKREETPICITYTQSFFRIPSECDAPIAVKKGVLK